MTYDFFETSSPELVEWVRANSQFIVATQDACVLSEGERDSAIFIVESGCVRIETNSFYGSTVLLASAGAGTIVGEMSWLENRPAVANIWASPGTRLLRLSRAALTRMQRIDASTAVLFFREICKKLSLQIRSQNAWVHRYEGEKHQHLRKVFIFFSELTEQDIEWLSNLGQYRCLLPGDVLIDEGQAVSHLSLVLAGSARVQTHAQGQLQVVGTSRRGELIGEMSMCDPECRGASALVDTTEGLELLCINIESLLSSLESDKERELRFWRALARMLSQRSRDQLLEHGLSAASSQAEINRDDGLIELNQLTEISTAGARFDWLCHQIQNQRF